MTSVMNGTLSARGRLRGWLLAALLLTLPLGAAAQEPEQCQDPPCPPDRIVVSGTVTNCAGQPLSGVTVRIQGSGAPIFRVTGPSGVYSALLLPGNYTVTPTPSGRHFFSPRSQVNNGEEPSNFTRYPRDNRANFDGDCKTDVSDFNRSNGVWHSLSSLNGQHVYFGFGLPADVITPGDYNGDGRTDYAVFRPQDATWYVATEVGTAFSAVQFGETADVPAAADYDGDGQTDIAVFRHNGGMWFIRRPDGTFYGVPFGTTGDIPVPGDYDGDGKADIAIFRPGPGDWWILRSSDSQVQFVHWGQSGDRPVQADYDDDGKTDIAVFRLGPADWYILKSSDGQVQAVHWGQSGDRPVPGDYDGDGRADIAIQRPQSPGVFWILPSATGSHYAVSGFPEFPVPLGYLSTRSWY
jgi:FG-GAP-like repeat/FG-GAP repeat